MRTHLERASAAHASETLLVLMTPALSRLEDLLEQGFVDAARARGVPHDILLVEIEQQQVLAGTASETLHQQVILPARAAGQHSIWMAGISLGAYNALHYAARYADHLEGMTLIAPYPGTADVLNEICKAESPAAWAADPATSSSDERIWWKWLHQHARQPTLTLHLALGKQDRFVRGQMLMASLLEASDVDCIDGDHSWPVWHTLWQRWLERDALGTTRGTTQP